MYSLSFVVIACIVSAVLTAAVTGVAARSWVQAVRDGERREHELALRRLRDEYAHDLQELQHSLSTEIEELRERARRPLKSLVDSFLG